MLLRGEFSSAIKWRACCGCRVVRVFGKIASSGPSQAENVAEVVDRIIDRRGGEEIELLRRAPAGAARPGGGGRGCARLCRRCGFGNVRPSMVTTSASRNAAEARPVPRWRSVWTRGADKSRVFKSGAVDHRLPHVCRAPWARRDDVLRRFVTNRSMNTAPRKFSRGRRHRRGTRRRNAARSARILVGVALVFRDWRKTTDSSVSPRQRQLMSAEEFVQHLNQTRRRARVGGAPASRMLAWSSASCQCVHTIPAKADFRAANLTFQRFRTGGNVKFDEPAANDPDRCTRMM